MIRFLFGPSNSLVLTPDASKLRRFELEEALDDIGRYYKFGTLTEASKKRGIVAVVFSSARKGHFVNYTPLIRSMDIPVTIFVQPDCVGVTRLPLHEELGLYQEHFNAFPTIADLEARAWQDAAWAEAQIEEARSQHGPLPYDQLDPQRFYGRWRDLGDFPPEKLEIGLDLPNSVAPANEARLQAAIAFASAQVRRPLHWATGFDVTLKPPARAWLKAQGFTGYLGGTTGPVSRGTDTWEMPRWPIETTAS